jgi:hypothetical protein
MKNNILLNIAVIVLLGGAGIYLLNSTGCNPGGAPPPPPPNPDPKEYKELEVLIDSLGRLPWNIDFYHNIGGQIDQYLLNNLIDKNQETILKLSLNNTYISTLNTAAKAYIYSGNGNGKLIFNELDRYKRLGKEYAPQVSALHQSFTDLYRVMSDGARVDASLQKEFDKDKKAALEASLRDSGQLNTLKDSPYAQGIIRNLINKMDAHAIIDYKFKRELESITSQTDCSRYEGYQYYFDECIRLKG